MKSAQIIGRLGKELELRTTPQGTTVINFDLAVDCYNHSTKERESEWWPVVIWGQGAEFLANYAKVGDVIAVKGELRREKWDSKKYFDTDGNACVMQKSVVNADMGGVELFSKGGRGDGAAAAKAAVSTNNTKPADQFKDIDFGGDDDIPF